MKKDDPCQKYVDEFTEISLASILNVYIGDLDLRHEKMNKVFDAISKSYKSPKILDLALGGGYDSVMLAKKGYEVVSNEIDDSYIPIAQKLAKQAGVKLNIRVEDWRNIIESEQYKKEEFDIVFSLGNSFPNYLLDPEDRKNTLKGFWKVLKKGGTLFFDARNFDYIQENAKKLNEDALANFKYLGNTTFLNSNDVQVLPTHVSDEKVHLCWKLIPENKFSHMDVWLASEQNIKSLIKQVLGDVDVKVYYDYQSKKPKHFDFVQFEVKKV